ncbi:MAG: chromosomal replication initiator protein DnaA [Pseudomonadota bacterium]
MIPPGPDREEMSEVAEPNDFGLTAGESAEPVVSGDAVDSASSTIQGDLSENTAISTTIDQCWALAIADVCRNTNPHIVAAYIEPLELDLEASTSSHIVVRGPSRLICNYVTSRYSQQLRERLAFFAQDKDLLLSVIPAEKSATSGPSSDSPDAARAPQHSPFVVKRVRHSEDSAPTNPDESQLTHVTAPSGDNKTGPLDGEVYNNINPRYTFTDFVVGNSNQFCHAAAMRVAEKPGQSYNPLFIYGGVGLGKTHLLHAIGNAVLERSPTSRVLYMSSETFTNELILALRHAKMEEFKKKLRTIEVLLIDDIQFISGKERTQEEFFHTFNALYSAKRQIVITSDKIPTDIPGIEERLQTRFSWGLTADLQAPDFETRVAILKQKALLEDFQLPHEVSHMIAERISSNVRELEGALTRLHAMSSIQSVPISLEMAKTALKPLLQPKVVNVTVDDIKKAVSSHFNIKVSEIVSKRRTKNLSFPRHIAMYLCRKHTTASYPEIGEHFGGRDHSSVIHAASVVSSKLSTDSKVKEIIENIEKIIFG